MGNRRILALMAALSLVAAAPAPPPDLALFNRITWGANESGLAEMRAVGTEAWLQSQLHPTGKERLPEAAQSQIDALPIANKPLTTLMSEMQALQRHANQMTDPVEKQAAQKVYQEALTDTARQSAARDILRDLYSPAQLQERMTWFWFNHFNVHQYKSDIRPMLGDYVETALRPHALGKFRDLVMATVQHPAMLRYLDNAASTGFSRNENYARELMELHTMGVGGGYTQTDVQELSRILTGVGIDTNEQPPNVPMRYLPQLIRNGIFEFNPARHDFTDKTLLGHPIEGRGFAEVEEAVTILCRETATAHHISRQLATYFMDDTPQAALVDRMAAEFARTDGDIAAVLSVLFHAPGFTSAAKFKDPARFVLSAVRLAYDQRVILNTQPIQGWLNRLAEGIYNHETPDGYALVSTAWTGPGQLAARFEVARQIGFGSAGLFKPPTPGATDRPGFPTLQNALYFGTTRATLAPPTRAALDQTMSPQEWNLLFLSSPDFMY